MCRVIQTLPSRAQSFLYMTIKNTVSQILLIISFSHHGFNCKCETSISNLKLLCSLVEVSEQLNKVNSDRRFIKQKVKKQCFFLTRQTGQQVSMKISFLMAMDPEGRNI